MTFVRSQNLPEIHRMTRKFDEEGLEVFEVVYGPPQDCPSGCFYLNGFGVRSGTRIGWLRLSSAYEVDPDSSHFFDVLLADSVLCRADVWDRMQAANDNWFFWNALLPYLAEDPDTAPEALRRISRMLHQSIQPQVTGPLLDNPWVQQDVESLCNLTKLSDVNYVSYQWAAKRAQELLVGLNANCSTPEP